MIRQVLGGMPGPNDLATQPGDPSPLCEVCDLHEPDGDECGRCDGCIGRAAMELDDLLALTAHLEQRAARAEQALAVEREQRLAAQSRLAQALTVVSAANDVLAGNTMPTEESRRNLKAALERWRETGR